MGKKDEQLKTSDELSNSLRKELKEQRTKNKQEEKTTMGIPLDVLWTEQKRKKTPGS